ncbi:F-box and FNIP repeat-containing protein [Cotonvirus japonicus]|uniref:F-box and FNIP repeat-containing protein n=1 Tax=Cotonvirus japonicus TaxID=2811091 RepID=A0ABM7NRD4_9VIRU|nr:F-box and FNIP repeat-containing protein [Cotonvirus japonicus]BCS82656.1 F-box and FNIP repeat-containing protein [Cotonvirus japonicus]
MEFIDLPCDIIMYIRNYLNDCDTVNLLSTNSGLFNLKHEVKLLDVYEYDKVKNSPFYNNIKFIKYKATNLGVPEKITHLTFENNFNEPIENKIDDNISKNLISLDLGCNFNHPINEFISKCVNLKDLRVGCWFNQPLDKLPPGITHLTLGNSYICSLKNVLPNSLTHITFGDNFNESLENIIPPNIKALKFGFSFNQPITGVIPNGITHLFFDWMFDQQITGNIPSSVIHLDTGRSTDTKNLPSSLKYLGITCNSNFQTSDIPQSIKHLDLRLYDSEIHGPIPDFITHLSLDYKFKLNPNSISTSVKTLTFKEKATGNIKNMIPDNITHLIIEKVNTSAIPKEEEIPLLKDMLTKYIIYIKLPYDQYKENEHLFRKDIKFDFF